MMLLSIHNPTFKNWGKNVLVSIPCAVLAHFQAEISSAWWRCP